MRFWDASAIVSLLFPEMTTAFITDRYREDPVIMVWWGTETECISALARVEREDETQVALVERGLERLDLLKRSWHEIQPSDAVRDIARRLLRVHPLRAADSLQIAAAVIGSETRPSTLAFVCLDHRLSNAARKEGFQVISS